MLPKDVHIENTTIIGAGASGLYYAYRLNQPDVSIHECTDRIGGRMYTFEVPHSGGLLAELGAMRFRTTDTYLWNLIQALKVAIVLPANEMSQQHFHFIKNKKFTLEDYRHPERIPYTLADDEKGLTPDELFMKIMNSMIPGIATMPSVDALNHALDTTVIDGRPLRDWDLGDLVRARVSPGGYSMLKDALGFEDHFDEHNASTKLFHNFFAPEPITLFKFELGTRSLIEALTEKVTKKGVSIVTNSRLTGIYLAKDDPINPVFRLTFYGQADVYTRHVVLTISPLATLALDPQSVLFNNPKVRELISTAKRTVSATKVFMVYDKPWWHEKGLREGRIHTDLCLRQLYDVGSSEQGGMMMVYKDTAPDWKIEHKNVVYQSREIIPDDLLVPKEVIQSIVDEMRTIFNDPSIEPPHTAFWKVWTGEQAAYFMWYPHVDNHEVKPFLRQPYKNIFITGDCVTSQDTGWFTDAIENIETVLALRG